MHNPAQHAITTAADLRAALAGVPDERRVVVMRGGEQIFCELMMRRCGDWVVLEIANEDTHSREST